jgi:cation:H+ antiporter
MLSRMEVLVPLVLIIAGFFILIVGGESLVRSAVSIALKAKISPAVVGLTIVAAGTSAPELFTSVLAALRSSSDIAVGNVVGSNIFNIFLILGLSSLIAPTHSESKTLKAEWLFLLLTAVALIILGWNLHLARWEGLVMILALAGFILLSLRAAKRRGSLLEHDEASAGSRSRAKDLTQLALGILGLIIGADLALRGGVQLGELFGLSERVIGITIISAGTGLPELVTSAVAAIRRHGDIAIANVLGSNIFNTFGVLGATALIAPVTVSSEIFQMDIWWMLGASVALIPFLFLKIKSLDRWIAAGFLLVYGFYLSLLLGVNF